MLLRIPELRLSLDLPRGWSIHSSEIRRGKHVVIVVPTRDVQREPGDCSYGFDLTREPAIAGQTLEERVTAEIRAMIRDDEPWERGETTVGGCRAIWFETTDGIHEIITWVVEVPGGSWVIANAMAPGIVQPGARRHRAEAIGTPIVRGITVEP